MMKRLLALLLTLLLVFSLTACSLDQETVELAAEVAIALLAEPPAGETEPEPPEELPLIEEEPIPAEEPLPEEDPAAEEPIEEEVAEDDVPEEEAPAEEAPEEELLDPHGVYTTKEDVALYLYTYGTLPENFMTKSEAKKLGWEGGGLDRYAYGMCIGGDKFGNYEGRLPDADGRRWTECDIDTLHANSRGAKRIVFSNDGLIYYTEDHYESFELLYGED